MRDLDSAPVTLSFFFLLFFSLFCFTLFGLRVFFLFSSLFFLGLDDEAGGVRLDVHLGRAVLDGQLHRDSDALGRLPAGRRPMQRKVST